MVSQPNSRPFRPPATSALVNQQGNPNNNFQAKPTNFFPNPQAQPQHMGMVMQQQNGPLNSQPPQMGMVMQQQNGPLITQAPQMGMAMQQQNGSLNSQPPQMGMVVQQQNGPLITQAPQMGMAMQQQNGPLNAQAPQMGMVMQQQNGSLNAQQPQMGHTGPLNAQQVPPNFHGNQSSLVPNSQIQSQMGMVNPQMFFNNFNTPMLVPMLVNPQTGFMMQMNANQPFNQFFAPNLMNNFPMNQNPGFQMQNMNQFVQRPMSNMNQTGPCNVPVLPNQFPQVMTPQNPNIVPNSQFGLLPNTVPMQPIGQNNPNLVNNGAQVAQGNTMIHPNFQLAPSQQASNGVRPLISNISQGNYMNDNGMTSPQGKWKNHPNGNYTQNNSRDGLQKGFPKNNNMPNWIGTVGSHFKQEKKGYQGQVGQKRNSVSTLETPHKSKKKLSLNYTEHEIQQWREERKKNFPSNGNIEKKQQQALSEENERINRLRRQQLKDILEKQAKLGCEVADIPSHYLYDSEKLPNGKEENTKAFGKREKFQKNKSNKRGRSRQNDRSAKKQKFREMESIHNQNEQFSLNKREPTLLRKLLSADIRRDNSRLLQVFRFMVMNSFLKDWPQTPLSFPLVMVKEGEVVEDKSILEKGVFDIKDKMVLEEPNIVNGDESGDDDDENDHVNYKSSDAVNDKVASLSSLNCIVKGESEDHEEEEGEIVE